VASEFVDRPVVLDREPVPFSGLEARLLCGSRKRGA
jgi:hypothetical protein